MFYNHEILTRREHGVATIWLVATLGSKSTLKKVTRKAINDVDVPKAVQTILSPDAPMALRLQGNLLYGVSRVYSQQCSYVQSDLQSFWDKLRHSSLVFDRGGIEIDPEAGRARPDQLNLQDDPAFLPDLDINLDLRLFDLPLERSFSQGSSQLPSLDYSSRGSPSDHEPQLELPPDDTSELQFGGLDLGIGTSSAGHFGSNGIGGLLFEEPGIVDNADLQMDDDGNIFTPIQTQGQINLAQGALAVMSRAQSKAGDSTGITDRVRAEHEAGLQGQSVEDAPFNFEDPGMLFDDQDPLLPDAASFSARQSPSAPPGQHRQSSSVPPSAEVSSVIEVAPQRRLRAKPAIRVDDETQLHNSVLQSWGTDYLYNMAAERKKHDHLTSTRLQAKRNAEHLVLDMGLTGLGREFDDCIEHPLRQALGGQALFDLLTDTEFSFAGKKRSRASDGDEDDENGRRVRRRSVDEADAARGDVGQFQFDDGDGIMAQDDPDMPIEFGRQAPSSIPDVDSARYSMPWNPLLSSRGGSARPTGFSSSAGGLVRGFDPTMGPPSSIPGHRLTSASPLLGRGKQGAMRYSSLQLPDAPGASDALDALDDDSFQLPDVADEEFEIHGPAARVSTQQADNSQWLASTLEDEANNFFIFLRAEIERRHPILERPESQELGSDEAEPRAQTVTFGELLPPERNSNVVGAQGLLHLLSLATKGTVMVRQDEDFGDIKIGIAPGVSPAEDDGDAHEEDEMESIALNMDEPGEATSEDLEEHGA